MKTKCKTEPPPRRSLEQSTNELLWIDIPDFDYVKDYTLEFVISHNIENKDFYESSAS